MVSYSVEMLLIVKISIGQHFKGYISIEIDACMYGILCILHYIC